jgi:putative ABC transport system substrate-binding protein
MIKTLRNRFFDSSSGNLKSKIKNRKLVGLVALAVNFVGLAGGVEAQQAKKVPRIGYLSALDPAGEFTRSEGIRAALRERGYIEGQNIAIEYRYGEGKQERYPELAAELVRLKVDIIVVSGGVVRAAKNATKTIPIVMRGWVRSCRGRRS